MLYRAIHVLSAHFSQNCVAYNPIKTFCTETIFVDAGFWLAASMHALANLTSLYTPCIYMYMYPVHVRTFCTLWIHVQYITIHYLPAILEIDDLLAFSFPPSRQLANAGDEVLLFYNDNSFHTLVGLMETEGPPSGGFYNTVDAA